MKQGQDTSHNLNAAPNGSPLYKGAGAEYHSEKISIYQMDCMDLLRQTPDNFYSLSIVDPPYGIGGHEGNNHWVRKKFSKKGKEWDSCGPSAKYFSELFRVSKNQVVWGANYFTQYLPGSMGWICWFKTIECVGRAFSECEFAYTSFDCAARIFELKPFQRNGTRIHPTQKPIELYKFILDKHAKPGDKILDTHLGSGSIAIACHDYGFDLTACELDPDYYAAAMKRITDHTNQLKIAI